MVDVRPGAGEQEVAVRVIRIGGRAVIGVAGREPRLSNAQQPRGRDGRQRGVELLAVADVVKSVVHRAVLPVGVTGHSLPRQAIQVIVTVAGPPTRVGFARGGVDTSPTFRLVRRQKACCPREPEYSLATF